MLAFWQSKLPFALPSACQRLVLDPASSIRKYYRFSVYEAMSEEIDKRVLRKYEIREKLGKGVRLTMLHRMDRGTTLYFIRFCFLPLRACAWARCGRSARFEGRWHRLAGVRNSLAISQPEGQVSGSY